MKNLLLVVGVILLLGSCMPMRISQHEKNHWKYQKRVRAHYYRTYPYYQQRRIKGKAYIPYFRPGKY